MKYYDNVYRCVNLYRANKIHSQSANREEKEINFIDSSISYKRCNANIAQRQ